MHSLTHAQEMPLMSDFCNVNFARNNGLHCQYLTQPPVREEINSCNICHKTFPEKSSLKIHYMSHAASSPSMTEMYAKSYNHKPHPNQNTLGTTDEKSHTCDICHKGFASKSELVSHSITHSKEKPYMCDMCSKAFADKWHLKRHYYIHTKEKPHVCDICSKDFARKDHLQKHYRTHSKGKSTM